MSTKYRTLNVLICFVGIIFLITCANNSFTAEGWLVWEMLSFAVIFVTLISFSIWFCSKRKFIPFLLVIGFMLTAFMTAFAFLKGRLEYKQHQERYLQTAQNLRHGKYDALIKLNQYPENGTKISYGEKFPTYVYKDDKMQMIFFMQGYNGDMTDYCGVLFISNERFLKDAKVSFLLKREFDYKRLDNNWFWVSCYEDIEPGP